MKTFRVSFRWQAAGETEEGQWLEACAYMTSEDGEEPDAEAARDHLRKLLPSGSLFEVASIAFEAEGPYSRTELSLMAEVEALGYGRAEQERGWLERLAAAGLGDMLEEVVRENAEEEVRERVREVVDRFGLVGFPLLETVGSLYWAGKAKKRLYVECKRMHYRLERLERGPAVEE